MSPEIAIRESLSVWAEAFCRKNAQRVLSLYAEDAVIFAAIPPYSAGISLLKEKLHQCFAYFPDDFSITPHNIVIRTSADLAIAHWLWRFTDLPDQHPARHAIMRSSAVWQRRDDRWLIVHDHHSVPVDPNTSKAALTLFPWPVYNALADG